MNIPVVQGQVVEPKIVQGQAQSYQTQPQYYASEVKTNTTNDGDFNGYKGEVQPKKYNDVFFAILFYVHLAIMGVLLVVNLSSGAVNQNGNENGKASNYSGIIFCVFACGLFAIGLSSIALGFMMQHSTTLVKMALFFSIGCNLAIGILGLMAGQMLMGCIGMACFAFSCLYAWCVWDRIPFAAANLNTALTAVKENMGLWFAALLVLTFALVWSVWWAVVSGGMMSNYGSEIVFLFLVSYFWVHQVLQNTLHVVSAGVIGTWWFAPEECSSCCSTALTDSFKRATTYSFGSICFGSLLVAIVQALRQLHRMLHDNEDFNFLVCIIDCLLGCLEGILEYLNQWAYVYVGLYGYSYLEAGKNVITLFQNKGWTTIITDNLAENVLFMISIGIGLVTGLIGLILASIDKNIFAGIGYENPGTVGFIVGLLVGFVLSSILMSVVGSAVNTVIVCFAEAPAEFERNHNVLSNEMRSAWLKAWPDECGAMR